MTKYLVFTLSALMFILLLVSCPQNITIESKASAQLPVPDVKSSTSSLANPSSQNTTNNNAIITTHTTSYNNNTNNAITLLIIML